MAAIKAYLFDLDGTLMDSERIYVGAVRQSLLDRGAQLTPEDAEELVYGKGWKDVYADSHRRFPSAYPDIEGMAAAVHEHFVRMRGEEDIRIPGSIRLLIDLARDHPVAIVSGSPRREIEEGIRIMQIEPHLEFFLGAEDYGPGKPDPACYRLAASRLALPPDRCLVFEDSRAGVTAAKRAGMLAVGLRRPGAPYQDLSGADAVLGDLSEFDPAQQDRPWSGSRGSISPS